MSSFSIGAGSRFDSVGATLNVSNAQYTQGADSSQGTVIYLPPNLQDDFGGAESITVPSQSAANRLSLFIELNQQGLVSDNRLSVNSSSSSSHSSGSTWYKPWTWSIFH